MLDWFRVLKHRRYVYNVTTAALILASGYGWLGPADAENLRAFLAVALVTGMASANSRDNTEVDK